MFVRVDMHVPMHVAVRGQVSGSVISCLILLRQGFPLNLELGGQVAMSSDASLFALYRPTVLELQAHAWPCLVFM